MFQNKKNVFRGTIGTSARRTRSGKQRPTTGESPKRASTTRRVARALGDDLVGDLAPRDLFARGDDLEYRLATPRPDVEDLPRVPRGRLDREAVRLREHEQGA